ncbi:MAG: DNA repair exonuclease [Nitrososphaeria archaeon]
MLIAHISDTHLGAAQFNLRDREEDVYEAFDEIIQTVIKDRVEIVIHSGDILDSAKTWGTPLIKLYNGLRQLYERGIKFYFTLGEHDISRIPETPSLFLFERIGVAKYIGDGKPITYNGVTIVGLHKHRKTESNQLISKLKSLDQQTLKYSGKKILVLHQGLYELHRYAGEITASDLPRNFDYYALGHLHDRFEKRFRELKGIICYPGSIDAMPGEGVKETEKGFYIVDMSGEEAHPQWVNIKSSRKHMCVELEYDRIDASIRELVEKVKGLQKKPVLSIKIKGKNLSNERISRSLENLNPYTLYLEWEPIVEKEARYTYISKPSDLDEETFNLAVNILGAKDKAEFAVKELLPLLSNGRINEAFDLTWKVYEEGGLNLD